MSSPTRPQTEARLAAGLRLTWISVVVPLASPPTYNSCGLACSPTSSTSKLCTQLGINDLAGEPRQSYDACVTRGWEPSWHKFCRSSPGHCSQQSPQLLFMLRLSTMPECKWMIQGWLKEFLSNFWVCFSTNRTIQPAPPQVPHICFVSGSPRIPPWSTSPDFILKPSGQVWNLSLTGRALLQLSRVARGCEWFSSRNIELLKIERSWWQTSIPIGCTEAFRSNGKRRACDGCMCRCLRAHQRRLRLGKEP